MSIIPQSGIQINSTAASNGQLTVTLAPGQSTQFSVKDVTGAPVTVATRTQAIVANGAACAYTRSPGVVSITPVSFTLQPGESRDVSVATASSGPAGTHDISVQFADLNTVKTPGHDPALAVVAAGVIVKYPGVAGPVPKCLAFHPHKPATSAVLPPRTVSTGPPAAALIGGAVALALLLTLVVYLVARLRKSKRT